MQEITKLIKDFDERITLSDHKLYDVFGLENGEEQLKKVFSQVKEIDYEDELLVDQPEPLISYILSCHGNQHEYLNHRYLEFKDFVRKKMAAKGVIKITKSAGIFICKPKRRSYESFCHRSQRTAWLCRNERTRKTGA